MHLNPSGLVVFLAFCVLVGLTVSFPASPWVYLADGIVSVIMVLHLGGFLTREATRMK